MDCILDGLVMCWVREDMLSLCNHHHQSNPMESGNNPSTDLGVTLFGKEKKQ